MPVFDFSNTTEEKKACECTYTTFQSNENTASAKYPILVLDNSSHPWEQDSAGKAVEISFLRSVYEPDKAHSI